jgi:hypothetical protein
MNTIEYGRETLMPYDPPGARVVHNFPPAPGQEFGGDGYRYWVTDEAQGHRCHCDGIDGEHYGSVHWVDAEGHDRNRADDAEAEEQR